VLSIQNLHYSHPNKDTLFRDLNLNISRADKIALIGNNGSGKSTLLRLIGGLLQPVAGTVRTAARPYYVPQHFGQYNGQTIAEALGIAAKLAALEAILSGDVSEAQLSLLDDDWTIDERCQKAFAYWGLQSLDLKQSFASLSGGQKTKVFLAGIDIYEAQLVLLDEPSNHLDGPARAMLYDYIRTTNQTLIVVSHDRTLLNLLPAVYELSKKGFTIYGGNYDFYAAQKAVEAAALADEVGNKEKELRKAREVARESMERQQKLDARGRKKQEKAGVARIMLNTLRNNAEKSTARMKDIHEAKTGSIAEELGALRNELPDKDRMKLDLAHSAMHRGKVLVKAKNLNYAWSNSPLWPAPLNFEIRSADRIAIKGSNGSGKSTLIRLITGALQPASGSIYRAPMSTVYIDQDYSLIDPALSVYQQAARYNTSNMPEHELKSRLTHFLFAKEVWDKPCAALSGGEKMRLILCCLVIGSAAPDMIILDEPTNNLDIQNIEILTSAVNDYKGTLLIVSHDRHFLDEMNVEKVIALG
jgi:ATPase subunit of ABC transporter with duplicated ATPase domains